MTKQDIPYLEHILEAINDIEQSVKSLSKQQFVKDKDVRDANVRRIEVIGEAVKNISSTTRKKYKEIEWNKIAGTRDKMIHHYFGVDFDIVWNIITSDLPKLKEEILKIKDYLQKERET